jgi:hypothetical protein
VAANVYRIFFYDLRNEEKQFRKRKILQFNDSIYPETEKNQGNIGRKSIILIFTKNIFANRKRHHGY